MYAYAYVLCLILLSLYSLKIKPTVRSSNRANRLHFTRSIIESRFSRNTTNVCAHVNNEFYELVDILFTKSYTRPLLC